ncbi:MAG TPA: DnaJ domain-containing protein [Polyangiaceae bacterium]|nr:DnaJ domain-containing protein [Polyangiaceae bacterium]
MHLVLGGAVLAIIALLSFSAPDKGRKQLEHTLLGALTVGAIVLVLTKMGMPWLAVALALLATSAKRFSAGRRSAVPDEDAPTGAPSARRVRGRMTPEEAYRVLGLSPGATKEQIVAEYRRLMKRVHPDQGGTTYLAAQLNEAKDCLLGD